MADFSGARLLVFRIADVVCAADAAVVREIIPAQVATRVPGAPEVVVGVINVRGRLVTLVDGRRSLHQPAATGDRSIVLVDVGAGVVGLTVDEVIDLVSIPAADLADRDGLPGVEARFIRAVGRHDGQTFAVLDTDALLGPVLPS